MRKRGKQIWSMVLVLAMLLTMMPVSALAMEEEPATSGICGKSVTWKFENNTLTISGVGDMEDYGGNTLTSTAPWYIHRDSITTVVIDQGITNIGNHAFAGCRNLSTVTLPEGITSIGSNAFAGCAVTEMTLPNSVRSIGSYAYNSCRKLEKITIPSGVTAIGDSAFGFCASLASAGPIGGNYNIQYGWTSKIPDNAFSNCTNLTDVAISDDISEIGESAFIGCDGLVNITLPQNVEIIGKSAFQHCSNLEQIVLSDKLHSIEDYTFYYCTKLKNINIPDYVATIGTYAFANCTNLESIDIPESVHSIGGEAFYACTSLTQVVLSANVTNIGRSVFKNCTNLVSAGPVGGDFNIQFGWTQVIPDNAFSDCNIITVTMPTTITSIGVQAFAQCYNLKSITIPDGVINIGDSAFSSCTGLTQVILPESVTNIGESVFRNCINLDSAGPIGGQYDIQFGWMQQIPNNAFEECDIVSVTVPDSISRIGSDAFGNCDKLTNLILPSNVKSIMQGAFWECTGLIHVYYAGSENDWNEMYIENWDDGNTSLINATIHYNSTGPDDPGTGGPEIGDSNAPLLIGKIASYDQNSKTVVLNGQNYTLSDAFAWSSQYVDQLVVCSVNENTILDIEIVRQGRGTLSEVKTNGNSTNITINGYHYLASPHFTSSELQAMNAMVGQEVLYLYGNVDKIYYMQPIVEKKGALTGFNLDNKTITLDYDTNLNIADTIELDDEQLTSMIGQRVNVELLEDKVIRVQPVERSTVAGILTAWDGAKSGVIVDGTRYALADYANVPDITNKAGALIGLNVNLYLEEGELVDLERRYVIGTLGTVNEQESTVTIDNTSYPIKEVGTAANLTGQTVIGTMDHGALASVKNVQSILSVDAGISSAAPIEYENGKYQSDEYTFKFTLTCKPLVNGSEFQDLLDNTSVTCDQLTVTVPQGMYMSESGALLWAQKEQTYVADIDKQLKAGDVETWICHAKFDHSVPPAESPMLWKIQISVSSSKGSITAEKNIQVTNVDIGKEQQEEIEDLAKDAKKELARIDLDEAIFLSEEYSLLQGEFGLSDDQVDMFKRDILMSLALRSISEDVVTMPQINIQEEFNKKYLNKFSLSANDYDVHLQYIFETEKYGKLTLALEFNVLGFQLDETNFAKTATINYEIKQEKKPPKGTQKFPNNQKSGELGMLYQYDIKAFSEAACKLVEKEIKNSIYDGTTGKVANLLARIVFSDTTNAIFDEFNISPKDKLWDLIVWPTKNITAHCPINVFVYDNNGQICGSIENNKITKQDPENFTLMVQGDSKYVLGLEDGYNVKYVATDNGTMDVEVTEEIAYDTSFREVTFNNVPLTKGATYSQFAPSDLLAASEEYKIVESMDGAETTIYADEDVIVFNPISDGSDIDSPDDSNGDNNQTSGNSSSGSGSSSSTNRYTVSVASGIDNGSIRVSPSRAERGDTVTITVDPDEGYELDTLTVTDSNGNRITTEKESDTRYTFEMPRGRVSIDAAFIAIEEEPAPQPSGEPFIDVSSSDWFYDAVEYVYETGMMNGASSSLFEPNGITTRAMIVTILHRLEGEPSVSASRFTDVAPNMYYADAVGWAQKNGIVNGTSTTAFSPNDPITREQMAAILYRYAQFKGYDISAVANLSVYRDVSQISSYALPAMQWANAEGLITGDTSVTINPLGGATRAEAATILMRFCENIA